MVLLENSFERYKHHLAEIGYDLLHSCLSKDSNAENSYTILLLFSDSVDYMKAEQWACEFLGFKEGLYAD